MNNPDAALHPRTLRLLFAAQILSGVAVAVGLSVGAILAAELVSVRVSGLAQSAVVLGAALLALPASRIVRKGGRRPSLTALYLTAALGASLVVVASTTRSVPLLFLGYFLFGGGTAASLQARFAAVDHSPKERVGRDLSLIVWATTIGGVLGPNLAPVAARTLAPYDIPALAAPFVFSLVLFTACAGLIFALMRSASPLAPHAAAPKRAGIADAFRVVRATPDAALGIAATAVGQMVMTGVMAMTPVHIMSAGHSSADTIRIVGFVISIHIAGMYAFAPLMGMASDRFGRHRVVLLGVALLLTACAIAGTAGHDTGRLAVGLLILGLGWSATLVSGSTLVASSIAPELKPAAQGLSDLTMGLAGATAGALSGLVVAGLRYPALTLIAALLTVPLAVQAVRRPVIQVV